MAAAVLDYAAHPEGGDHIQYGLPGGGGQSCRIAKYHHEDGDGIMYDWADHSGVSICTEIFYRRNHGGVSQGITGCGRYVGKNTFCRCHIGSLYRYKFYNL